MGAKRSIRRLADPGASDASVQRFVIPRFRDRVSVRRVLIRDPCIDALILHQIRVLAKEPGHIAQTGIPATRGIPIGKDSNRL